MLGGDRVTQVRAVIQGSGGNGKTQGSGGRREDPGFWGVMGTPRVLGGDGMTQGSGGRFQGKEGGNESQDGSWGG